MWPAPSLSLSLSVPLDGLINRGRRELRTLHSQSLAGALSYVYPPCLLVQLLPAPDLCVSVCVCVCVCVYVCVRTASNQLGQPGGRG